MWVWKNAINCSNREEDAIMMCGVTFGTGLVVQMLEKGESRVDRRVVNGTAFKVV